MFGSIEGDDEFRPSMEVSLEKSVAPVDRYASADRSDLFISSLHEFASSSLWKAVEFDQVRETYFEKGNRWQKI